MLSQMQLALHSKVLHLFLLLNVLCNVKDAGAVLRRQWRSFIALNTRSKIRYLLFACFIVMDVHLLHILIYQTDSNSQLEFISPSTI